VQLVSYRTPKTFMDMDHVRYLLLFPHTEMVVTLNGDWYILKWENCHEFESSACTCKLHNTPAKPRTCTTFNAYNCWYKKNFVTEQPPEIYRLNLDRFDIWVNEILFDEQGRIVSAPNFEESQAILNTLPIEPSFQLMTGPALVGDIRLIDPDLESPGWSHEPMAASVVDEMTGPTVLGYR
jgi:hypothetical protein